MLIRKEKTMADYIPFGGGDLEFQTGKKDLYQDLKYRKITLDSGDIKEAINDWLNKKTFDKLAPNWDTFTIQTLHISDEPLWGINVKGIVAVLKKRDGRHG